MMEAKTIRRLSAVCLLAVSVLLASSARAQVVPRIVVPGVRRRELFPPAPINRLPKVGQNRPAGELPPNWVERLRDMQPAEQEQFMRNNQRFQSLPPDRQ